jgi:PAS domain S-box-containing protein
MTEKNKGDRHGEGRGRASQHLAEVLQTIDDAFFGLDDSWRFTYVNKAGEDLLRIKHDELIGRTIWEVLNRSVDLISHHLHRAMAEREPVRFEAASSDGNRWCEIRAYPWGGGLAVYYRDITESKHAEEALRYSEERLRLAVEAAQIGTWRWDLERDRLTWDSHFALLLGLSPDAPMAYDTFLSALHPEDLEVTKKAISLARTEGRDYEMEFRTILPDQSVRWIMVRGRVLFNDAGRAVSMIGLVLDITSRKEHEEVLIRARDAAESANRIKTEFLANMSHEIRTPMTVVMAAIEQVMEPGLSPEKRQYLEMAENSAEALLHLIDDLLDFSKVEAGKLDFSETSFDLRTCVQEVVESLALDAQRKGLRLDVHFGPQVPAQVYLDPNRLRQVLANLVGNAIKFTERGEVTVTVDRIGDERPETGKSRLLFSVRDTGIGIPEDKKKLLFQSFSQADSSITRRYGGTGLGLALSKEIVQRMGGTIRMESQEGTGSVFSFILPFSHRKDAAPERLTGLPDGEKGGAVAASGGSKRAVRILLVEDDAAIRALVQMVLQNRDFEVITATDGEEGLSQWQSGHFDLILMDVQMPRMDGLEATRLIRQMERSSNRHIPILALTAHARQEDEARCREAGMDGYLAKPIRMEALYTAIDTAISSRS